MEALNSDAQKVKLFCPLCSQRLEPLIVDTSKDEKSREETIWWTCFGVRSKTCDFPLSMPPEVFWTTRNEEQINNDVVPLPNFHLLPPKYHHLYPGFFNPSQRNPNPISTISRESTAKTKPEQTNFPQHPSKVIHRPSLATKRRKHGCVKSQQLKVTSINESLELIDSHVRYLPDESSINARLGKQVSKNGPAVEHTIDPCSSTESRDFSNNDNKAAQSQFMDTLPLYSSNSSNLVEQSASQLPDDNPLNVQLFGDNELDSLFKENLNGLLRNKKVKKPRKKEKTKPIQKMSDTLQSAFPLETSAIYSLGETDEYGFADDSPWFN